MLRQLVSYCTPVSSSHVTPCPPSQIGDQENAFAPLVSQYSTWSATWQLDDATSLLAGALSVHRGVAALASARGVTSRRGGRVPSERVAVPRTDRAAHQTEARAGPSRAPDPAITQPRTRASHAPERAAHRHGEAHRTEPRTRSRHAPDRAMRALGTEGIAVRNTL